MRDYATSQDKDYKVAHNDLVLECQGSPQLEVLARFYDAWKVYEGKGNIGQG